MANASFCPLCGEMLAPDDCYVNGVLPLEFKHICPVEKKMLAERGQAASKPIDRDAEIIQRLDHIIELCAEIAHMPPVVAGPTTININNALDDDEAEAAIHRKVDAYVQALNRTNPGKR